MGNWLPVSCSGCGSAFSYHADWARIPDLCKGCIAEKRAARAKWHEKKCPCGNVIKYHEDWSNPPTRCKDCNTWLTKTCAAEGCTEEIRYKGFWDRVPDYCRPCKNGERRCVVRQEKDDGTVHEYEGNGYVNRQGLGVFADDGDSGKHSHTVFSPDGAQRGHRDEGFNEDWVNAPVSVTTGGGTAVERMLGIQKHNRYSVPYKDRGKKDVHVHDWVAYDPNTRRTRESSNGEYFKIEKPSRKK